MTDPFDFGSDWQSEEEKHEHCVVTEDLCGWLSHSPHGHPGGCCTCNLQELPVYQMYGFKSQDDWEDSEANRIEARKSLLAWRIEEALKEGSEAAPKRGMSVKGESFGHQMPVIHRAPEESHLSGSLDLIPNQAPRTVYEQIARDSQEPPRIIPTAYPVKHGSILISHKFHDDGVGTCTNCKLPRQNRIHLRAEKPQPPILQALIDAVSHTCNASCHDKGCRFSYRAAINKVRRILNEVQR